MYYIYVYTHKEFPLSQYVFLVLEQGKCESYAEWLVEAFGGKIKGKVTSNGILSEI